MLSLAKERSSALKLALMAFESSFETYLTTQTLARGTEGIISIQRKKNYKKLSGLPHGIFQNAKFGKFKDSHWLYSLHCCSH